MQQDVRKCDGGHFVDSRDDRFGIRREATDSEVAMVTLTPLLDIPTDVPDPRRAEGKIYKLRILLPFRSLPSCVVAIPIAALSPSSIPIAGC